MIGYGLDPNCSHTGLVRFVDGVPTHAVTVTTNRTHPSAMANAVIEKLIAWEQGHGPAAWAGIEGTYVGPNKAVATDLIKLVGVLEWYLSDYLTVYTLSTVEIDRACDIVYRPGGRKAAVGRWTTLLERVYELSLTTEHERDALAVGFAAAGLWQQAQLVKESIA